MSLDLLMVTLFMCYVYLYYWHTHSPRPSSPVMSNLNKQSHQLRIRILYLVKSQKMQEYLRCKVKRKGRRLPVGGRIVCVHHALWHTSNRRKYNIREDIKHFLQFGWKIKASLQPSAVNLLHKWENWSLVIVSYQRAFERWRKNSGFTPKFVFFLLSMLL